MPARANAFYSRLIKVDPRRATSTTPPRSRQASQDGQERGRGAVPGFYNYAFNGIVRLDKRTNKDYGFGREDARAAYRLNPSQQRELRRMKGEILHKFVGDELLRNPLALLGGDATIKRPSEGVAWLSDYSGIFMHEEAEKVIKALQWFYSRVSREELAILRTDDGALSHEDLEAVRAYIGATLAAA